MKIMLTALNAKYVHSNLAVYNLEAYVKKQWNQKPGSTELVVREYTINHNLDWILQSIYQEKAQIVAFSCYIWNIHEILTISKELKKVEPSIRIWLGGPEVSYDSVKLLEEHPFIEGIMQGEGEITFFELVSAWERGDAHKFQSSIMGIAYRDQNDEIYQNPARPLMVMDEVPFIYKDLSHFKNKILYYETSRGCPFSCSYCLSSIDKSIRFRSFRLIEPELSFFLEYKVSQVKFVDRTFNCNRKHSLAIWNYIMEHDNGVTNFHFEIAADLIGEEELNLFQKMRPGLIQLEIGLQSTHRKTIQEIRRVMNIEKLKHTMLTIRDFQTIHQHLDLIAGLPYENFNTFQESFNDAYEMRPHQLQLGFLKVLKGSYIAEQIAQYELKYQDFQPYEVLSTKWITYDEILMLKQVEEMLEVYYNSGQYEHVLRYLVDFFESPYYFYEALGQYYKVNQLFGIGYKREARYEVLRTFSVKCLEKCECFSEEILDSLLTYDYYLRENAKTRPSWVREEPIARTEYHTFFINGGNEEICLRKDGYDSKIAARVMHIEPIIEDAVLSIQEKKLLSTAVKRDRGGGEGKEGKESRKIFCLFDYENRNPLSKDAKVTMLSYLCNK